MQIDGIASGYGRAIERYRNARYSYHRWRFEAELVHKLALALTFAAITGLAAQMRLYLPFTPVPVTGQVFAVLISAVALGRFWAGLSQALYAGIGALWIPWFAPKEGAPIFSSGGLEVVFGSTGGYILGFVLAALVLGWVLDGWVQARRPRYLLPAFLLAIALIYGPGVLWLSYAADIGLGKAVALGAVPFLPGDLAKAVVASGFAAVLLPKRGFGPEKG